MATRSYRSARWAALDGQGIAPGFSFGKAMTDSEQLAQRNRELAILTTVAAALNGESDLATALGVALDHVSALFGLHSAWVWLLNEASGQPYLAASKDLPPALGAMPELMEGTCYCLDRFCDGHMGGADNINIITCTRLKGLARGTNGLRYHASVPLYAHQRPMGVMNVASADWRALSAEDLRLLYAVGDLVGMAVERAQLFKRSVQLGALEERNRLAREIHDSLAQSLAATALQLDAADAQLEGGAALQARAALQRAIALIQASLDQARRSVLDLRAAPLDGLPLAEVLAQLAAPHGVLVRFSARGAEVPVEGRVAMAIYRIAQEALSNALRHAGANAIGIVLAASLSHVQLAVEDDGQGFDPDRIYPGHFGLIGMRERCQLLGGSMQIASAPGLGTRIECILPNRA